MANSYSIIIAQSGNTLTFTPDLMDLTKTPPVPYPPNTPLGVNQYDNVTWNNQTNFTITLTDVQVVITPVAPPINPAPVIVPTVPADYLTDPIPPGLPSDPIFNVTQNPGTTIQYSFTASAGVSGIAPPRANGATWTIVV